MRMRETSLRRFEWVAAAIITLAIVYLHYVTAVSAGALWRDEANTIALASMPSLSDVWKNLQFESFPLLWLLIVRACAGLAGPMNDAAFRVLGFCVGVGLAGALWFNARSFNKRPPLLSLSLLALSPAVIRYGDSMRAYGFGMLLSVLACALLWRFVESPAPLRFAAAAAAAVCSVQTLFYNAVLLLAFCCGGAAVMIRGRRWRDAALVLLIGLFAAISLLPYLVTIKQAGAWSIIVRSDNYSFRWFCTKLNESIISAGVFLPPLWGILFVTAVVACLAAQLRRTHAYISPRQRDAALFALVTLIVGSLVYYVFLRSLSYPTQAWYYLSLLALIATSFDLAASVWTGQRKAFRAALAASVIVLAAAVFVPNLKAARLRMTNIDIVAGTLASIARPGDFVLVNPWYYGVSFRRYYIGPAQWTTIPPISPLLLHRYDLIKEKMMMPDQAEPITPLLTRLGEVLRSGNRVYVVGSLPFLQPGEQPLVLPPAPQSGSGWAEGPYISQWAQFTAFFVQHHASNVGIVPVDLTQPVNAFERPLLLVIEGWNE